MIYFRNGKLLFVGGKIAMHVDCCCSGFYLLTPCPAPCECPLPFDEYGELGGADILIVGMPDDWPGYSGGFADTPNEVYQYDLWTQSGDCAVDHSGGVGDHILGHVHILNAELTLITSEPCHWQLDIFSPDGLIWRGTKTTGSTGFGTYNFVAGYYGVTGPATLELTPP